MFAGALALCLLPGSCLAQQYYAQQMGDGTFKVYDPTTKKTEYVRDVRAWAANEQFKRTGFGGGISQYQFQQGDSPVADTVKVAAQTVDAAASTAVNTALDAASYVPGWSRYSGAARQALHGGSGQARR
jgi:hypothetical protein